MMKRIFIVLLLLSSLFSQAQVKVYETCQDYINKKPTEYAAYNIDGYYMNVMTKEGKSTKISGKNAFCVIAYDTIAYRFVPKGWTPVMAKFQKNGLFYFVSPAFYDFRTSYCSTKYSSYSVLSPSRQFMSTSFEGEMYEIPMTDIPVKKFKRKIDGLKEKFPEYTSIFACMFEKKIHPEMIKHSGDYAI